LRIFAIIVHLGLDVEDDMAESSTHGTFGSALAYKDPEQAIEWLTKAFGFEPTMLIRDDAGKLVHSELGFGDGYIMVGDEWAENIKAPSSVGGANTQHISVHLPSGVNAHYERAKAAGARITMEPNVQSYGARVYVAVDPEGHEWDISEPVTLPPDAMEKAGMTVQRLRDEPVIGTFFPEALYKDARAAVDWLCKAFGFETTMVIESDAGIRAHLAFQGAEVAVGSEYVYEGRPSRLSPLSVGGGNTQTVHIQLQSDVDAHCERARAAGATIVQEPETQFYGDRTYRAIDPEGHMWTVAQTIKVLTPEEWDAVSGLKTTVKG
jgi:uncharacterized glyoxalase superfamily protein PhnB